MIVLYDGLCGFCDGVVQWLLARDPQGLLRFAPLQGDTAARVRARHPEWLEDLDSIVVVVGEGSDERIYWHSAAVWSILAQLGGGWGRVAWLGRLVPRGLADLGYRIFARLRLRIAGRRDACRVPTSEQRARFLT